MPARTLTRPRTLVAGTVAAATLVLPALASPAQATDAPTATAAATQVLGGKTTLTTTPGIVDALVGAGVTPTFSPQLDTRAVVKNGKTVVSSAFRVTGGRLDLAAGTGRVDHSGSITFTRGASSLTIGSFQVVLGAKPQLTAKVNAGARVPVFDLDLAGLTVSDNNDVVRLCGVKVNLTKVAADALDTTLDTTVFTPGLTVGSVRSVVVVGSSHLQSDRASLTGPARHLAPRRVGAGPVSRAAAAGRAAPAARPSAGARPRRRTPACPSS